MKINEVYNQAKNKLDFDLVDDAIVFMKNDPMFYRKQYFPAIATFADMHREGNEANPKEIFMPMIEKGIHSYCKKYQLADLPDEIFRDDDRHAIFDRIFQEELKEIQKGEYN